MTATLLKHACTHMHLCLCSQQQRHGLIQQSLKNLFSVVWCHLKVQSAVSVCLGVFRMDGNVVMKPPNLPVVDRIVTPCGRRCGRHHKMQRSSFAFFSSSLSFLEFVVVCLHLRLPVLVLVVCLLVVRSPACSLCQTMSQVNLEAKVVLVGSQRECAGAHPWCLDEVGRNDSSSMGGGKTSGKTPTPKHAFLLFRGRQDIAGGAICPERV